MTHPMLDFLNRCLDETERVARAAQAGGAGRWSLDDSGGEPELRGHDDHGNWLVLLDAHSPSWDQAQHVIRHDPAAVLAIVEAHRMILSLHKPDEWGNCSDPCISNWSWAEDVQYEAWPCPTVRALASAYRYAPGFDPSWGPQ